MTLSVGPGGAPARQLSAWSVRVWRWGSPPAILHSHQVHSDDSDDSDDNDDDAGTGVTHTRTVPGVMMRVRSCVDQSPAKVSLNDRNKICCHQLTYSRQDCLPGA